MRTRASLLGLVIALLVLILAPVMRADSVTGVPMLKLSSDTEFPHVNMTISSLGTTTWSAQADTRYFINNATGYDWTDLHVTVTGWSGQHDFGCDPHSIFSDCVITNQHGSLTPIWDFSGVGAGYSGVPNGMWFDMHFSFGTPSIPGGSDNVQWTLTPSTAIPEPATLTLLIGGGAALLARRKPLARGTRL